MSNPIRFHNPGRQFGKKCEKCGHKMKDHAYIDVDEKGRIVACSVQEGIKK
jgi:ribosomal protein L37AE/L43A